ncbi:MAG: enoyl-CoA hydratase family protein [Actinomycetota bacterium]|jgi:enoyl-CoA hydratase/carnithine racemase|nr:enoyl-CoA hydratase family protein [Actinomycetota bacterium]
MTLRGSVPFHDNWEHFDFEVDDRVATIRFNRPDKLNALTFEVYADLRELFREIPLRGDIDSVIITGEGRGFCSGGDVDEIIGELLKFNPRELLEFTRMTGAVIQNMRECPATIISAINGTVAGAGAVIALASDFRLVVPHAKFRFLFTNVGLSGGDMGSAYLLPRLVGLGRATEILMFGEAVTAEQAVDIGLANRLCEPDDLLAEATTLARRVADGPRLAYGATKLLLSRELDMDLAGAIEFEAMTQALLMNTEDHAEFHASFHRNEPPNWKGQ